VRGNPTTGHGVEAFGQTGRVIDLYRHFGIDHESLVRSALRQMPGRRNLKQVPAAQNNVA